MNESNENTEAECVEDVFRAGVRVASLRALWQRKPGNPERWEGQKRIKKSRENIDREGEMW